MLGAVLVSGIWSASGYFAGALLMPYDMPSVLPDDANGALATVSVSRMEDVLPWFRSPRGRWIFIALVAVGLVAFAIALAFAIG